MPRKQVVILHGSARTGGMSDRMAETFAAYMQRFDAADIVHIRAYDVQVKPCTACDACKTGTCVIDDDMQRILPQLELADVVVVATPVYFCGVPAPLKMIIDRMQPLFFKKYVRRDPIKKKVGVLLSCCEQDVNEPFVGVMKVVESFFFCLNAALMEPVFWCARGRSADSAVVLEDKVRAIVDLVVKK